MKFHARTLLAIFLLAVETMLVACGAAPISDTLKEPLKETGNPLWVDQGTATLRAGRDRVFLGVGKVSSIGDFGTQATVANKRARDALTQMVTRYLDVLSREYIAANKMQIQLTPSQADKQINSFTQQQIATIDINTYWHSKREEKIYAAAHLDFPTLTSIIVSSPNIDQGLKLFFKQNGSAVFDRLAIRSQKELLE